MKKILRNPGLSKSDVVLFESLVKSYMKRAYFVALGIIGSHDAAMELSQEAFIRAYRNFKSFDKSRKFFTWYYKILRNLCLNFIRDNRNKTNIEFIEQSENKSADPQQIVEQNELLHQLEIALTKLDMEEREIIILREFENYSYSEISETLEIPIGTVMSRLYYARKKLAEKMEGFAK